MEIKLENYLSLEEIKDIAKDELRNQIKSFFKDEGNAQRLLSNLSYQIVFDEIDKVIPNSRELVVEKTKQVLNNTSNYGVFRDGAYGGAKSLAYLIMEETVRNSKELLNEKVKATITNTDYSEKVWDKFEELGDTFISNIYSIVELGRKSKQNEISIPASTPF